MEGGNGVKGHNEAGDVMEGGGEEWGAGRKRMGIQEALIQETVRIVVMSTTYIIY